MNKTLLASAVSVPLALLLISCGDVVVEGSGGAAGAAGSGGSGTGGTTTTTTTTTKLPGQCALPADGPGPYPVTFRFENPADSPVAATVYLRKDCALNYEVRQCADGFQPIALSAICTLDCADGNECIQCEACPEDPIAIQPGQAYEEEWDGTYFTFEQNAAGCTCHDTHVAPAQIYELSVPVYGSGDAAVNNQPDFKVDLSFDLPAATGVVEVKLYPPG